MVSNREVTGEESREGAGRPHGKISNGATSPPLGKSGMIVAIGGEVGKRRKWTTTTRRRRFLGLGNGDGEECGRGTIPGKRARMRDGPARPSESCSMLSEELCSASTSQCRHVCAARVP